MTLTNTLSISLHIDTTIASCNQALFALRTLRAHGLNNKSLHTVYNATVLSKLTYSASAWYGFTNAHERYRLVSCIRKSVRAGFCAASTTSFHSICEAADDKLFKSVCMDPGHVLHRLLPQRLSQTFNLRTRAHDFVAPRKTSHLDDCNFLMRMLYKNIY